MRRVVVRKPGPLAHHCAGCKCFDSLADPGVNKRGAVRRNAHDTEEWAADAVLAVSGRDRLRVLQYVWESALDGATDYEMEQAFPTMDRSTVSTRRGELVKGGWMMKSGRKRRTRTAWANVWVLTPAGLNNIDAVEFTLT